MNNLSVKFTKIAKTKKAIYISLGIGVTIGASLAISPGTFFVIILATICCFFVLKYIPASERKFVKWVFIIGLILRMVISVALDIGALVCFKEAVMQKLEEKSPQNDDLEGLIQEKTRSFFKMGDSDYFSGRGYVYTAYAKGVDNIIIRHYLGPAGLEYGWSGYLHVIGLFYYLFGYSPVAVKFLNCLIGVVGAVFIYKIGLNFNKIVAKIAFLTTIFFPSLIIWSTTNFKGPTLTLTSAVSIWAFIVFLKTKKIKYLAISLFGIPILYHVTKEEIWLILMVSILLTFFAILFLHKKILLIFILGIIYLIMPKIVNIQDLSARNPIEKLFSKHIGHVNSGGVVYKVLNDKYYGPYGQSDLIYEIGIREFAVSATKSIIHFLFEPFPNRMVKLSFFLYYIQMLLWNLLFLFACVGFVRGKIYSFRSYLPVFLYVMLGSAAIALGSGNIGTLIRHRDILSPFYFVFAAVGIVYIFRLEGKKNESLSQV